VSRASNAAWKGGKAAPEYEEWVTNLHRAGKSARTIDSYTRTVRDLLAALAETRADEFDEITCEQFLLDNYPYGSRHVRAAHLHSFFEYLYRSRQIPRNPMDFVEMPKPAKRQPPDDFTEAEIAELCALDFPDGPLFTLMFECGLRKGDCRVLRCGFSWRRDSAAPR
jgi:site-specific recombinase XerD